MFNAEKIISSCRGFDEKYDLLTYYHIDDLYFIEYRNDDLENNNQNYMIKEELDKRGLIG